VQNGNQGRRLEQISVALRAAAMQIGQNTLALATKLKHDHRPFELMDTYAVFASLAQSASDANISI
jgi:hypothetical protein